MSYSFTAINIEKEEGYATDFTFNIIHNDKLIWQTQLAKEINIEPFMLDELLANLQHKETGIVKSKTYPYGFEIHVSNNELIFNMDGKECGFSMFYLYIDDELRDKLCADLIKIIELVAI